MTDVRPLSDVVLTRLQTMTGVNVFDGEVIAPPLDPDGRVHAYAVFYPTPGRPYSQRQGQTVHALDWSFQVTCVGGDRTRCLWTVDKVRGVLEGWRIPGHPGGASIKERGDVGPLRRDEGVQPPRSYLPLVFSTAL